VTVDTLAQRTIDQRFQAVVVGGGPAGLAAALELLRAGVETAIVDENRELGGQFYKRRTGALLARHGDHRSHGTELIAAVRAAGAVCLTQTVAWGAEPGVLHVLDRSSRWCAIAAEHFVFATGAYERVIPFPGWTLPGVFTAGFALQVAEIEQVAIGHRAVVAGTGPFLLAAACALAEFGVEVAAVLEANRPYRLTPDALPVAFRPQRLIELARMRRTLHRHRVPVVQRRTVERAEGRGRVERVIVASGVSQVEEQVADTLIVGHGFRPNTDLPRLLGCACERDRLTGELVVRCDANGRTSVPGVVVAGELRGIAGAEAALTRGRLAAYAVLEDLGRRVAARRRRSELARASRSDRFARLMHARFRTAADLYARIPDDTVVCRCEAVTAAAVRAAAAVAWNDLNGIKAATRAGMGLCQGRECGRTVEELYWLARPGALRDEAFTARMPTRPLPVEAFID
jgi:D-hydroxyproline dehydrogenase subunit alpha